VRIRRYLSVLAIFTLVIGELAITAKTADAVGLCQGGTQDNRKIFTRWDPASGYIIDRVEARATIRDLQVCISNGVTGHFTAVLPVNLEVNSGGIWQLGYGKRSGENSLRFVKADGNANAIWISNPVPHIGESYEFRLTEEDSTGKIRYKIYNVTADPDELIYDVASSASFNDNLDNFAWFGYETQDGGASDHGHVSTSGNINIRQMNYSYDNNAADFWYYTSNSMLEYQGTGMPGSYSDHHGHVTTDSNNLSLFDGETH
jgi:hypothetical protein